MNLHVYIKHNINSVYINSMVVSKDGHYDYFFPCTSVALQSSEWSLFFLLLEMVRSHVLFD